MPRAIDLYCGLGSVKAKFFAGSGRLARNPTLQSLQNKSYIRPPYMSPKPLAIDLFAGLGGWTDGLLAEGWDVVGFDIEQHVYGGHRYPAQLVVQDALTLHGSQFKDADLIVASPPCQEYSYMAMPWTRAKQIARALRGEGNFPDGYKGSRKVDDLNALFDACFRIQREASQAAGRHVPMVVENVRGAQPWVGRAAWNFGSYYLWGDVPALMPMVKRGAGQHAPKNPGFRFDGSGRSFQTESVNTTSDKGRNPDGRKNDGSGWRENGTLVGCNRMISPKRKLASAMIAKIPFELSRHIAAVYNPAGEQAIVRAAE